MTNRFVALVAAAGIALAGFSASPAQAGYSDFEKFVLGAGALVLFGAAVNSHKKHRNTTVIRRHPPKPHYRNPTRRVVPSYCVHGHGHNRWVDWGCVRASGY